VQEDATSLASIATAARRRWIVIGVIAVLAAIVGAGISLAQPNKYQAVSKVLIGSPSTPTSVNAVDSTEIATQSQVVASLPVAAQVASKLGLSTSPTDLLKDVTVVTDTTRVLTIDAIASTKSLSVDIANGFAVQYLAYQQEKAGSQLASSLSSLARQATQLQTTIATLDSQIARANGNRAKLLSAKRQALAVQLTRITAQQAALPSSPTAAGEVLLSATSASPYSRIPLVRTTVLAGILGLVVGFGVALLLDRADDRVHDEDGLGAAAPGLPVLGRLPRWTSVGDDLISLQSPDSAASESFRQLGASLRSALGRLPANVDRGNIVVVTSPRSAEGKTETAANLAVTNARVGLRVVLVDANLRNRALSVRLKLGNLRGLSDVLVAPYRGPELVEVDEIQVLPAGTLSSNPAEILGSTQMAGVLDGLAEVADLVIVDTSGTLQFADAAEIFARADLVAIVCRADKSTRREVGSAVSRATALSRGPVGLVLNQTRNA
jgi:capsular exopolysaccharide synthesis family protein